MPDPQTRITLPDLPRRLFQVLIVEGLAMELYGQQWLNAIVVTAILMLTVLPAFFDQWAKFSIPYQFEVLQSFLFSPHFTLVSAETSTIASGGGIWRCIPLRAFSWEF